MKNALKEMADRLQSMRNGLPTDAGLKWAKELRTALAQAQWQMEVATHVLDKAEKGGAR